MNIKQSYVNRLVNLIKKARFIWIVGNGGSASTAEHLACDLLSKGYRAVALSSNSAVITMIANDFGYKYIFGKQLKVYGDSKDLLITISCSGTSSNIVNAQEIAKQLKMKIFCFETFNKEDAMFIDHFSSKYGELEDKHMELVHKLRKIL